MDRGSGTPPPYDDAVSLSPQVKPALETEDVDDSRGRLLQPPGDALTPADLASSKIRSSIASDGFRRLSLSPGPSPLLEPIPAGRLPGHGDEQSEPPKTWWARFWQRNKPSVLVALSQFFGSLMNLSARLVELEGRGMHPVQVLLMRQSVTALCCLGYMWWVKTPGFPFGPKNLQWLLLLRGFSGFFGIFGLWYSMMYLPLADATVITFLAPGVAGMFCYFALREPFTRIEQLATLVALFGVVLIAKPTSFFAKSDTDPTSDAEEPVTEGLPGLDHEATAEERLIAVGFALLGVLGAAGAFTTLRTIGKRAHPLISVNYFAIISSIICILIMVFAPILNIDQPSLRWTTPHTLKQWLLMLPLGILGFIMQYLLTSGLGADKSNRANSMIYTHMLFAATWDRWVFGHRMGGMSAAGCILILGSAIGVILVKKPAKPKTVADDVERQSNMLGELEASPMLLNAPGTAEELRINR